MTNDSHQTLERIARRVPVPAPAYDRLLRRRGRKERNRRLSAGALAIILAIMSFVALARAFRGAERPADEPKPKPPGIFSEVGGWIAYGNQQGIWAVDPLHPADRKSEIQLSTDEGTPLAWSSDGSKLLIVSYEPPRSPVPRLFVLNADGAETQLATVSTPFIKVGYQGGSFSPDGSQVSYTDGRSIYVVDTKGGTPRVLLTGGRRWFPPAGRRIRSWLSHPTYSPDGTQIAYFDHQLDSGSQLRVMNADGSGVRVLLHRAGLPPSRGYHIYDLAWSPDGERLAWGGSAGIFIVGADGSGLSLVIPGGAYPHWSPDGTRLSYQLGHRPNAGPLQTADADGTHVVVFGGGSSGPWNPLIQPEPEIAEMPAASQDLTLTPTLLFVVALLALVAGVVLTRRRMRRNARP
jgi:Tol biopolymer transport system component